MLIYIITLFFMQEYINISDFGIVFFFKVLIIVIMSWGTIDFLMFVSRKIYPSYRRLLMIYEAKSKPEQEKIMRVINRETA